MSYRGMNSTLSTDHARALVRAMPEMSPWDNAKSNHQEDNMNRSSDYTETVEIVAGVARLLHRAGSARGHSFAEMYLATGASLASQHALELLPDDVDPTEGPWPVESAAGELIRAAEELLRQAPLHANDLVPGVPGLVAEVCGLVRDCKAA